MPSSGDSFLDPISQAFFAVIEGCDVFDQQTLQRFGTKRLLRKLERLDEYFEIHWMRQIVGIHSRWIDRITGGNVHGSPRQRM
jgi:hypothetical protein